MASGLNAQRASSPSRHPRDVLKGLVSQKRRSLSGGLIASPESLLQQGGVERNGLPFLARFDDHRRGSSGARVTLHGGRGRGRQGGEGIGRGRGGSRSWSLRHRDGHGNGGSSPCDRR